MGTQPRRWKILAVQQVQDWYDRLPEAHREQVARVVHRLAEAGPMLERPAVELAIIYSANRNLRILCPRGDQWHLPMLFALLPIIEIPHSRSVKFPTL